MSIIYVTFSYRRKKSDVHIEKSQLYCKCIDSNLKGIEKSINAKNSGLVIAFLID